MRFVFRFGVIAVTAAVAFGGASTLLAPASAQDKMAAVDQRIALMKQNGQKVFGVVAGYVRQNRGTPADVEKAAAETAEIGKKLPALFVAGTSTADLPGKTRGKPEIWQDKAKFDGYARALTERAEALQVAAKTGDKEKIGQAFAALNRDACTACHNAFRAPEQR
jgi:cytochrome c556